MRRLVPVSGGKDSAALALYLQEVRPELPLEFVFCDTQAELPMVYAFLDRLEVALGKPVVRLETPGFAAVLEQFGGFLPAPWARWCTNHLKIRPFRAYVGADEATVYVGITADEGHRKDRIVNEPNILHEYPFVEAGIGRVGVAQILLRYSLADHPLYRIKPRSGCWCCFFQGRHTWKKVWEQYPDLYAQAMAWEERIRGQGENVEYCYLDFGRPRPTMPHLAAVFPNPI